MPTPSYGPKAGQQIPESEFAAYTQAYGIGTWTRTPQEQADVDNAAMRDVDPNHANLTPEENAAQERAAAEANARARAAAGVTNDVNPNDAARNAAAAGMHATAWDSFYANGPGAVQLPQYQTANQDQARQRQQQVIQDLQKAALGDPNSRAQQGLRDAYGNATSQQSSLGSTMRGQSAGAAARSTMAGQQGIQRGLAGDQQMLQLQEQQAAQQQLAQMLSQQQGQDIGRAQGVAQGALDGSALQQAMQQFYTQGGIQQAQGNYQYGSDFNRAAQGFDLEAEDLQAQAARRLAGAGATALSTMTSMGDGSSSSYRKIDGQDSIVPYGEK